MYFAKFNTIFPIIHSQTFRPTPKNSLLLLSICSIGSLLIGSRGAAAQGRRIFERLNKAILASVSHKESLRSPANTKNTVGDFGAQGLVGGNTNNTGRYNRTNLWIIIRSRLCGQFLSIAY